MAVLAGVAFVGAGYSVILLKDVSTGDLRTILQVFTALGLASFISLLTFASLWSIRRHELAEQRDRTRHLVLKLLVARGSADARQLDSPALLLIEDEENDALLLRRAFSRLGARFNFQVVNNGSDAQRYLHGEGKYADRASYPYPAAIVCDFKMPQCNGTEFLTWFNGQEQLGSIPFISLSGPALPEEVQQAKKSGATLCLEKSADFAQTLENARAIIATARSAST
jgi:CheY-like chemotaxis protein